MARIAGIDLPEISVSKLVLLISTVLAAKQLPIFWQQQALTQI